MLPQWLGGVIVWLNLSVRAAPLALLRNGGQQLRADVSARHEQPRPSRQDPPWRHRKHGRSSVFDTSKARPSSTRKHSQLTLRIRSPRPHWPAELGLRHPLVTELAVPGARFRVPVAVSCRVLNLHRQHYYAWLAQPVTDAELDETYVANALFDAHREDPEVGYRLLHDEITATGHTVSG